MHHQLHARIAMIAALVVGGCGIMACGADVSGTDPTANGPGVEIIPSSTRVAPRGEVLFATAGLSAPAVTWQVVQSNGGSITSGGLYTAPGSTGSFQVKVFATAAPSVQAMANVQVTNTPGVTVAVSPHYVGRRVGGQVAFKAAVTGGSSSVDWTVVEGSACGSVGSDGVYTAPASVAAATTCHVQAVSTADASATDAATIVVQPPAAQPIAVNIDTVNSDTFEHYFADVVKTAREFYVTGSGWGTIAPTDANGWPTVDPVVCVGAAAAASTQPYRLTFTGTAGSVVSAPGSVTAPVYDAATNTSTAWVTIPSSGGYLTFTNTWRRSDHAADATGNTRGITNISLLRPGHVAGDVFSHELIGALSQFVAVRPKVGSGGVNASGQTLANWSDRTRPTEPLQTKYTDVKNGYGMAWEYYVMLANNAGVDLYLTLPYYLTNDHVTKLAQLLKYGSDGTNPYASPQANPVFPPLDPARKVYIEYVNENWNGAFWTTTQMNTDATNEYNGGDPYHYQTSDTWSRGALRLARRTMEVGNLFRGVFGSEMGTRVKMVIGGQMANNAYFAGLMYDYLNRVYGPSNTYGNPGNPPTYWIHAFAVANYLPDISNPASVDAIFSTWGPTASGMYTSMDAWASWIRAHPGFDYIAYEGGQHLLPATGGGTYKLAAQTDSRMRDKLVENYTRFKNDGGGVAFYYTVTGSWTSFGYWGLSQVITDQTGPKWQAAKTLLGQ